MSKNSGIIYAFNDEEDRFGIAINSEQHPNFTKFGKVYLHVYTDVACTVPELDPVTKKKYVTLKHISQLTRIGFVD